MIPEERDADDQDRAETLDEDMIGAGDTVTSDEVEVDFPPDHPGGLPFADADVTDESFADRSRQEEPEVSARDIDERAVTNAEIGGVLDVQDLAADDERS